MYPFDKDQRKSINNYKIITNINTVSSNCIIDGIYLFEEKGIVATDQVLLCCLRCLQHLSIR